jgi:hypothetical protein
MKTLAATEVGPWIEEEAARIGSDQSSASHAIRCLVELDCHWLAESTVARFELDVSLQRQAAALVPQAVSLRPADSAGAQVSRFSLASPIRLDRVYIPKPWGQEIWYTGVEQRGVCAMAPESGAPVPLPWLLEPLAPWLTGGHRELVLLKILDPLPAPVWGDLYFELHEEKREVYVVTHVDTTAWPDGTGAIRFGFDAGRRASYPSDADFKSAYRASVAAYEHVRRKIDAQLDSRRREAGIALDAPLPPQQLIEWQETLDAELLRHEQILRDEMEAFTCFRPLRVGDVVKVPCYTPHALQHGVRTVEFQTPVYERKILSFAQKVLTQQNWDTDDGVALMALEPPAEEPFSICYRDDHVLVERIVDFADFQVQRWVLQPGASHRLELDGSYALVMAVAGKVAVGDCQLEPEQACLVPVAMRSAVLSESAAAEATVLVARPA